MFFLCILFLCFCCRKSYLNRQSNADHGNWDGCQLITLIRGDSSNFLDFNGVYSLYRFTEKRTGLSKSS